jgi:hypothetical protein
MLEADGTRASSAAALAFTVGGTTLRGRKSKLHLRCPVVVRRQSNGRSARIGDASKDEFRMSLPVRRMVAATIGFETTAAAAIVRAAVESGATAFTNAETGASGDTGASRMGTAILAAFRIQHLLKAGQWRPSEPS